MTAYCQHNIAPVLLVSVGSVPFVHLHDLEGDKAERYLLGWEQILRKLEGNMAGAVVRAIAFYQYDLGSIPPYAY